MPHLPVCPFDFPLQGCKPGMMEYQLESLFQHYTYTHGGCRFQGGGRVVLCVGFSGGVCDHAILLSCCQRCSFTPNLPLPLPTSHSQRSAMQAMATGSHARQQPLPPLYDEGLSCHCICPDHLLFLWTGCRLLLYCSIRLERSYPALRPFRSTKRPPGDPKFTGIFSFG